MQYTSFNKDVFLVKGVARHAIYDLNKGKLFHINQQTVEILENWLTVGVENNLSSSLKDLFNQMIAKEILVKTDSILPIPDIKDLKEKVDFYFAWVEVTQTCNLTCSHCYEGSSPHLTRRLSFENFVLIADQLHNLGITFLQFIGGEPTVLKEDLKRMIRYARNKFKTIEVYTNGLLIDHEWAKFFKEHKIDIAMSIHSYIPEEHDKLTLGKGSHKKVERAVDILKEYGIKYRTAAVEMKNIDLGEKTDENYKIDVDQPRLVGRANIKQYTFEMFKRKAITKEKKSYPIKKAQIIKQMSGHQCFVNHLYIDSAMNVFPCVMERRFKHGNLKEEQLDKMIDENIRTMNKEKVSGCKDCEFRYQCFDCRPDSNERDILSKPWYCSYNPYTGEWQDLEKMYEDLQKGVVPEHLMNV